MRFPLVNAYGGKDDLVVRMKVVREDVSLSLGGKDSSSPLSIFFRLVVQDADEGWGQ